jgi:NAD(P)-dependent dehydrogenase (short-subunit alcohol dehydrogenase family)
MVAFLFSDDGAYVTGQTILVDGGANFTWARRQAVEPGRLT